MILILVKDIVSTKMCSQEAKLRQQKGPKAPDVCRQSTSDIHKVSQSMDLCIYAIFDFPSNIHTTTKYPVQNSCPYA